jgi:hypothetical protein
MKKTIVEIDINQLPDNAVIVYGLAYKEKDSKPIELRLQPIKNLKNEFFYKITIITISIP